MFSDVTREHAAPRQDSASEERLRMIYNAMACGVMVWNASGEIVEINEAAQQIMGTSLDEIRRFRGLRRPYAFTRLDGSALPHEERPTAIALRTGRPRRNALVGVKRSDGQWRCLQVDAVPVLADDGTVIRVVNSFVDVTERKQAEESLRASEERHRRIVETAQEGIWEIDPDDKTTFVNRTMADLLGYNVDEMLGMSLFQFSGDVGQTQSDVDAERRRQGGVSRYEARLLRKDGTRVPVLLSTNPLFDDRGQYTGALAMVTDIMERVRMEDALRRQALHDALTGLPNRVLLRDRVEQAILAARRDDHDATLMLLDLDRFKEVNDTFGHHYGDALLRQVAERLRGSLRASDTVARLGGDEFAVLLAGSGRAEAILAADKMCAALEAPFIVEGQALHVGASIGIALFPRHGTDAATLLRRADVAMYVAKRGGDAHAVYAPEHDVYTPDRLALVADLRQAIACGALLLHYQPKASLDGGRIYGVEAIARWPHPRLGLIPPDQFIPLAEATGLIGPLTLWVLAAALAQCQSWRRAGLDLGVAVNLSMANLHDLALPTTIARLLETHDLPAASLRVEVTESAIMADPARTLETLTRLRALGVGISVDDYGTGYSSLAYLKRLPVDELKIDMSFVRHMAQDETDAVIVSSTIGLGHNLGLHVVAEGVEDREAWDALTRMGCDAAQGYHLSRPLPAADLERRLRVEAASCT